MTTHNKVYTEDYKATDEKLFWPISETVLYIAVNISVCMYAIYKAQTWFGVYPPLTKQTHRDDLWKTEIGSGPGEDFYFWLCIILCCVDFYNENISLYGLCLKIKCENQWH